MERIDYRHIIRMLVRKPAAVARYRWREGDETQANWVN
jgi:hypothetical protein